MHTTSPTLLLRLQQPDDEQAWQRFVALYTPLLCTWASRLGLQSSDAADLIQDVFALLVQKLPEFQYDAQQSFRGWLRTVLHNKWRQELRRRVPTPLGAQDSPLAALASPEAEDGFDEVEYRQRLVQQALVLVRNDFQPATWQAWQEYGVAGRPVAEVAAELGMTVRAVYLAKSRVLQRLREELDGLLDE
jgi:RNA polymerase sigma-70 factor (ECF subfamily)